MEDLCHTLPPACDRGAGRPRGDRDDTTVRREAMPCVMKRLSLNPIHTKYNMPRSKSRPDRLHATLTSNVLFVFFFFLSYTRLVASEEDDARFLEPVSPFKTTERCSRHYRHVHSSGGALCVPQSVCQSSEAPIWIR